MKRFKIVFVAVLLFAFCKEKYIPPTNNITEFTNLLVVEGYINTGSGDTNIKLSRSAVLQDNGPARPEVNATVTIEGENGTKTTVPHKGAGLYTADTRSLILSTKYRLRVKTTAGKEYLSDYVEPVNTAPVDSVYYKQVDTLGFNAYVATHHTGADSRYYKWTFDETWAIVSKYYSDFEIVGNKVVSRGASGYDLFNCWGTGRSDNINIGSSVNRKNNVVLSDSLIYVPSESEKIMRLYSILVSQYGLSAEAFKYNQTLKRNSEKLGSLFDAQPSEFKTNIRSVTNPTELVIGFISAGVVTQKRAFIPRTAFKGWSEWAVVVHGQCEAGETGSNFDNLVTLVARGYLILTYPPSAPIGQASVAPKECVDCRLRGSNVKPAFWP